MKRRERKITEKKRHEKKTKINGDERQENKITYNEINEKKLYEMKRA